MVRKIFNANPGLGFCLSNEKHHNFLIFYFLFFLYRISFVNEKKLTDSHFHLNPHFFTFAKINFVAVDIYCCVIDDAIFFFRVFATVIWTHSSCRFSLTYVPIPYNWCVKGNTAHSFALSPHMYFLCAVVLIPELLHFCPCSHLSIVTHTIFNQYTENFVSPLSLAVGQFFFPLFHILQI